MFVGMWLGKVGVEGMEGWRVGELLSCVGLDNVVGVGGLGW